MTAIPADYEVQPISPDDPDAIAPATCGHCGLTWDDGIVTGITPTPAARCPFEGFHDYDDDEEEIAGARRRECLGPVKAPAVSPDPIAALNAKRYTLTMTGAEVIALAGLTREAEQFNPARVSVADKLAELRAESFRDREEAYRR